jgi:hypothetical protein
VGIAVDLATAMRRIYTLPSPPTTTNREFSSPSEPGVDEGSGGSVSVIAEGGVDCTEGGVRDVLAILRGSLGLSGWGHCCL